MIEHILVVEDNKGKRTIILKSATYSVGRGESNSIILSSHWISRHHATLLRITNPSDSNYVFRIIDGNLQGERSSNGILVNGISCLSQNLKHKDEILFGKEVHARYYTVSTSEKNKMLSSYEDHEYSGFLSRSINPYSTQTDSKENHSTESALERLASFPEMIAQPIIELDITGNITYLNPYAIETFPKINKQLLQHPILVGLVDLVKKSQDKLIIREVKFGSLFFEQFIHYIPSSDLIRSYLVDITKSKQAELLLQQSRNKLELRVEKRTLELKQANQKLQTKIKEKEEIEIALRNSFSTNRALLNAIPDWMFRIDNKGIFINFSSGKNTRLPLNEKNFLGKEIKQVLPLEIASSMMNCINKALQTQILQVFEYQLGEQEAIFYEARIAVSAPNEVMVIIRDITERKLNEQNMQKALTKEKQLHDLKSKFITMTSHEFRTPLATILSSSELLEHYAHKWTREKQNLHFNRIKTAVTHMTGLLNDVLLLGKAEAGKIKFQPKLIDLNHFSHSLLEELQLSNKTHQIVFTSNNSPIEAEMDVKLLRQILTNLLSNAIKYSPESDVVNLNLITSGEKVIVRIQDFGIGIPKEDLKHLFHSFHRADNVGNISGTGLGLAIVKKAVELHNGSIKVTSQLSIGTTFTLSFPLRQNY